MSTFYEHDRETTQEIRNNSWMHQSRCACICLLKTLFTAQINKHFMPRNGILLSSWCSNQCAVHIIFRRNKKTAKGSSQKFAHRGQTKELSNGREGVWTQFVVRSTVQKKSLLYFFFSSPCFTISTQPSPFSHCFFFFSNLSYLGFGGEEGGEKELFFSSFLTSEGSPVPTFILYCDLSCFK